KPEPKLVATYDAGHLVVNVQDKAKAWRDLCMAMQALQE
ncbi:MAG: uracil-DNA glycosylase, partial [Methylotenera sp.]|nr:uracil-DNA glycosylase [Methylotenera sp.]